MPHETHSLALSHKQTQKEDRQEGPFGFICFRYRTPSHTLPHLTPTDLHCVSHSPSPSPPPSSISHCFKN
ncbi:hypothetical protein VNO77_20575 [Canavalia gladiata]|uniref:Uncharacterized protein n=1 Tax=Canavalia gladiata TaxID=3824 RepID=A0AAN9QLD5_CANGL